MEQTKSNRQSAPASLMKLEHEKEKKSLSPSHPHSRKALTYFDGLTGAKFQIDMPVVAWPSPGEENVAYAGDISAKRGCATSFPSPDVHPPTLT